MCTKDCNNESELSKAREEIKQLQDWKESAISSFVKLDLVCDTALQGSVPEVGSSKSEVATLAIVNLRGKLAKALEEIRQLRIELISRLQSSKKEHEVIGRLMVKHQDDPLCNANIESLVDIGQVELKKLPPRPVEMNSTSRPGPSATPMNIGIGRGQVSAKPNTIQDKPEIKLISRLTKIFGEDDLPQVTIRMDTVQSIYVVKAEVYSKFLKQWFMAAQAVPYSASLEDWERACEFVGNELESHVPRISFGTTRI
jgi:hypothetical protein